MKKLIVALLWMLCATSVWASDRPAYNIISIVSDDMATWAVGAYGNTQVATPNLDRLAREGVRFSNAFVTSAVCAPSRASYLTGLHTIQIGAVNDASSGAGVFSEGLPPNIPTWPRVLQQQGYATGLVGKWHLGLNEQFYPTHYGLDYFFGFLGGSNRSQNPALTRNGETRVYEGYTDDILTADAIAFIESHQDEPFSLMINLRAPHLPYGPAPAADTDAVAQLDPPVPELMDSGIPGTAGPLHAHVASERKAYLSAVHTVDRNVGRLLDALDATGLSERTIILFTSDNGYLLGERGLFNKGAAVPLQYYMYPDNRLLWAINMYDIAMRVPLLVRWPGVAAENTVIDAFVSSVDIFPSVLGMLGISDDEQSNQRADLRTEGRDFSPLLRGEKLPWKQEVFGQYTSNRLGNTEFLRMIRTEKWKLVKAYLNPSADQLFDLENDPGELHNLYRPANRHVQHDDGTVAYAPDADCCAEIRTALENRLREWQHSIGDPALELERVFELHQENARRQWD